MVEQDCWETLALEAPVDPENVHVVALFARLGAPVIAGSGAGEASTQAAKDAITAEVKSLCACIVL
jgi:hypothetical protein